MDGAPFLVVSGLLGLVIVGQIALWAVLIQVVQHPFAFRLLQVLSQRVRQAESGA